MCLVYCFPQISSFTPLRNDHCSKMCYWIYFSDFFSVNNQQRKKKPCLCHRCTSRHTAWSSFAQLLCTDLREGSLPLICCLALGPVGLRLDYYVNACASCPLLSPSWPSCHQEVLCSDRGVICSMIEGPKDRAL